MPNDHEQNGAAKKRSYLVSRRKPLKGFRYYQFIQWAQIISTKWQIYPSSHRPSIKGNQAVEQDCDM